MDAAFRSSANQGADRFDTPAAGQCAKWHSLGVEGYNGHLFDHFIIFQSVFLV